MAINQSLDDECERIRDLNEQRNHHIHNSHLGGSKLLWISPRPKNAAMRLFDDYYGEGHYVLANSVGEAMLRTDVKAVYVEDLRIPLALDGNRESFRTPFARNGIDTISLYDNIRIPVAFSETSPELRRDAETVGGIYVYNSYSNPQDLVLYLGSELMGLKISEEFKGEI